MATFRVLCTGHNIRRIVGEHRRRLEEAGCEVVYGPFLRGATEEELPAMLKDIDGVLASTDAFTRTVLEQTDRLKIIARLGVGYDAVDVPAATDHGVWVTTTPGTNELSVADMTLLLVLALARNFVFGVNRTREGAWERTLGSELNGLTLGLVGFGRIGRQVATRARAFGMEVIISDVFQNEAAAAEVGARYVGLEELLAQADVVSLHAPATPETRHLINARTLRLMKPTALLINTARGELVNEADLEQALRDQLIAGAGLDVFSEEPPPADHPLLTLPNVIPTAHIAGITAQSVERMASVAIDNVLAVARGERPPHPVNELRG